jgi:hypothetical protein
MERHSGRLNLPRNRAAMARSDETVGADKADPPGKDVAHHAA